MFDYLNSKLGLPNQHLFLNKEFDKKSFTTYLKYDYAPFLELESPEAYRSSHKSKFWYNIRRSRRLIEEEFGKLEFHIKKNKFVLHHIDECREIFLERWKNEYTSFSWKNDMKYEKWKETILKLADNSQFELNYLTINSQIEAYCFGFIIDNTYFLFLHAISPKISDNRFSIGTILIDETIRSCIDRKIDQFDFMVGTSQYKLKFTRKIKPVYWRVTTKKKFLNIPSHIIKVLFFSLKINLQKNKNSRTLFKLVFKKLSLFRGSLRIINWLESNLFKM